MQEAPHLLQSILMILKLTPSNWRCLCVTTRKAETDLIPLRPRSWDWEGQTRSGFLPYCKTRTAAVVRSGGDALDVESWGWPAVLVRSRPSRRAAIRMAVAIIASEMSSVCCFTHQLSGGSAEGESVLTASAAATCSTPRRDQLWSIKSTCVIHRSEAATEPVAVVLSQASQHLRPRRTAPPRAPSPLPAQPRTPTTSSPRSRSPSLRSSRAPPPPSLPTLLWAGSSGSCSSTSRCSSRAAGPPHPPHPPPTAPPPPPRLPPLPRPRRCPPGGPPGASSLRFCAAWAGTRWPPCAASTRWSRRTTCSSASRCRPSGTRRPRPRCARLRRTRGSAGAAASRC